LPALDAKIVAFPAPELVPRPSSSPHASVAHCAPYETATDRFRGGSLRGLFWALVFEGAVVMMVVGAIVAWHMLRQ
jgi:hypothetical protein